jgi:hypothetical protein
MNSVSEMDLKVEGDETLEEIWRIKDELSAKFGHDISRYLVDARKRQIQSGIPTINLQKQ